MTEERASTTVSRTVAVRDVAPGTVHIAAAGLLIGLLLSPMGQARGQSTGLVQAPIIRTYASQVKVVDAVNTHWIETERGVIIIDAQRLLPEAERALAHVRRATRSEQFPDGKPVLGIVVTHPHTDHYGGLSVWAEAYPEAPIFAAEATVRSMREDTQGFNAARRERHGEVFPTQAVISAHLPDRMVADGDSTVIGGVRLVFTNVGASEAEVTTVVYLPDYHILFPGDLLNDGVPAVPFESIDGWLRQLTEVEQRFPNLRAIYQGHGPAPSDPGHILYEQRRFLTDLRALVAKALASDNAVTGAEKDDIVFELEARYPFYMGVAGNTRQEMLAFNVDRVAAQIVPARAE